MAIFAKTIDHGSFRGAAGALRLSPSVVSHHISELEAHLGVALIYRTTRKLTLTSEGARLFDAAQKMLEAAETEFEALAGLSRKPSGDLRLTLPAMLSQSPVLDIIAQFSKQYPKVKLTLDFSDTRRDLISDGFDIALRVGPKPKYGPNKRRLLQVDRKLVASTEFLKKCPAISTPKDLDAMNWVVLTPAQNMALEFKNGRQTQSLKPKAQVYSNDSQASFRLALKGAGFAVVPQFLAEDFEKRGEVQYVLPEWSLPCLDVYAEWPVNAPKHGLIHLLLDALSNAAPVVSSV